MSNSNRAMNFFLNGGKKPSPKCSATNDESSNQSNQLLRNNQLCGIHIQGGMVKRNYWDHGLKNLNTKYKIQAPEWKTKIIQSLIDLSTFLKIVTHTELDTKQPENIARNTVYRNKI